MRTRTPEQIRLDRQTHSGVIISAVAGGIAIWFVPHWASSMVAMAAICGEMYFFLRWHWYDWFKEHLANRH
jgi:hypothetical protein